MKTALDAKCPLKGLSRTFQEQHFSVNQASFLVGIIR